MKVQEMSLFELALEVIKIHREEVKGYSNADKFVLLEMLAKGLHAAGVGRGPWRWGNTFIVLNVSKLGTPSAHVYDHYTASLMALPGWKEYTARKDVQAAELVEG
ncbi:hypothetical protein QPM17_22805 [Marinobacter sp. TBZ242]|uniref:Uncharacterized protein n=1 Tax=Marinobacter azerbaijanicus TaxID=3050455 RepID=A0ABT7IIH8_9GAMM|nr:hypothetical protein [Marinobacter sp. TBZ242]MDL0433975.1 hypothetical protein [Marinobacter sp. TBZ242]